jgi:anhydro-N-acetylmuramic acid kinase
LSYEFLGEIFAQAVLDIIAKTGYDKSAIDLIGSHGLTVCHLPRQGGTLQIGESDVTAERTGITTVGDFRPRDIAAGGEGAPLIPYADYLLFADPMINRVLLNIGGIANFTYIPASASLNEVLAFDTGPGNMLLDEFITYLSKGKRLYDEDGQFAACGLINDELLAELMEPPVNSSSTSKEYRAGGIRAGFWGADPPERKRDRNLKRRSGRDAHRFHRCGCRGELQAIPG